MHSIKMNVCVSMYAVNGRSSGWTNLQSGPDFLCCDFLITNNLDIVPCTFIILIGKKMNNKKKIKHIVIPMN